MKDLKNIKFWLFDLDNTLYDGATKVFDQVDKKMSKFINGLRVTDKNIIDTVEEVLIEFNKDIVSSLEKLGSGAASFHSKTISHDLHQEY